MEFEQVEELESSIMMSIYWPVEEAEFPILIVCVRLVRGRKPSCSKIQVPLQEGSEGYAASKCELGMFAYFATQIILN
jgi:hypothetical protein